MLSWRQSSLSRICKSLVLCLPVGAALFAVSPAQARSRHSGRHHPRPQPSSQPVPSPVHIGEKALKKAVEGCSDKGVLTVATYNVENFWDDVEANSGSANYDEYKANGSNWYNEKMYQKKAESLVNALRMSGTPDVVAMQEIESANNNSRSLEILKPYAESLGYKYFALGLQNPNNPVSVTTAVMSKYPIVKNERLDFIMKNSQFSSSNHEDDSAAEQNTSARDPQVVTINIEGQTIRLYTAHWKSRRGDASAGNEMRNAVAELIKKDIDQQTSENQSLDVLVMGDFNSDYNETPLQNGMNSTDDKNLLKADLTSNKMYNLWFELASSERCSYMHGGELHCLDHMLVNSSLFDGKGIDLVEESFLVVGHNGGEAAQKLLRSDKRTPNRWGMQKNNGRSYFTGTGYSDHLPLVATFKVPSLCKVGQ
jgi:predicted extracellular nuclease